MMNEEMINKDAENTANDVNKTPSKTAGEVCVPSDALSVKDDNGQPIDPVVGDEVEVIVKGKVSRVENGEIYVTPTSFNDVEVGQTNTQEDSTDEAATGDKKLGDASDEELRGAYRAMIGNGQEEGE